MALERRLVSMHGDETNPELIDMTRRFRVATALSAPLLLIVMGDMLPGSPLASWLPHRTRPLVDLALASPVCLWAAWPFYVRAARSVINRSLNMFTLIGLGRQRRLRLQHRRRAAPRRVSGIVSTGR
jgi:Cu+-exporting ATPase